MTEAEKTAKTARHRLIWILLETFSQKDVHAMLQRSISGEPITLEQVQHIRKAMLRKGVDTRPKNISLAHLHDAPIEVAAPVEPEAIIEPMPIAVAPKRFPWPEPESFESQMARLRAGARLISAPDFRTPPPAFTLGGVGSASL